MFYLCPKCGKSLTENDKTARCESGHCYDRAKEGYYNLLLGSSGGNHGDNREMVLARRDFLDTGAYKPLSDKIAEELAAFLKSGFLLDVGCGEGYYTDVMQRALGDSVEIFGFDISKDAVRLASKRNRSVRLSVASAYKMPFADSSFDAVTNMFSPLAKDEIKRVLKPDGYFIMAIPGRDHLFGLKRAAYKNPYKNDVDDSALEGFELLRSESVKYTLNLSSNAEVRSLFMMTPYAYRTPRDDRERVLTLESLETEVDFMIFVYKKL